MGQVQITNYVDCSSFAYFQNGGFTMDTKIITIINLMLILHICIDAICYFHLF